ncbi:hypothetical protein [Ancylomarina sp. 16SWW S1-10-2]|uniref:hypothetical protein n=1 Tax=Ancylomarina sp. 16SWW S1-10-2 TaxID=2499681 RepID=UPI0012AD27FE|nr:hypothetical protein [Ancylomarina sp. 16SWW S1-10-2]MRT94036.1 hypothetical protein [Ancylomarina sp. 16SWW S1-10-2]
MILANKFNSADLYKEIETLFYNEYFHSILKFEHIIGKIDTFGFSSEEIKCLYEIFVRTYLELNEFVKARQVVDQRLLFLCDKDMSDVDYADDLLIFTFLKMELLQKQNLTKEEYKLILAYEKRGKSDDQVSNRKIEIEEGLYMKYVKVNKYLLYLILLAVLLVNMDFIPVTENYIPTLMAIAVGWYILNFTMNCRVKRVYLGIVRKIYF